MNVAQILSTWHKHQAHMAQRGTDAKYITTVQLRQICSTDLTNLVLLIELDPVDA